MCGCGTTEWCEGGCECGCDHGTPKGMERQGRHFALQYRDMTERATDAYERGKANAETRLYALMGAAIQSGIEAETERIVGIIKAFYAVAPKAAEPLLSRISED